VGIRDLSRKHGGANWVAAGLEPEHLKISLLAGHVVHENLKACCQLSPSYSLLTLAVLQLKSTAFDGFSLPIHVKAGFLGKLTLNIPWTNLGSQPTVIILDRIQVRCPCGGALAERLQVIAGTTHRSTYDKKLDEKKALNTKLRRLEISELVRESTHLPPVAS
jgi:hypothetical protein